VESKKPQICKQYKTCHAYCYGLFDAEDCFDAGYTKPLVKSKAPTIAVNGLPVSWYMDGKAMAAVRMSFWI
jgi:hypothetical protein